MALRVPLSMNITGFIFNIAISLALINEIFAQELDQAHLKPVRQIPVDFDNNYASHAVDGDPSTCAITSTSYSGTAWWQVDLLAPYTVHYLTILASSTENDAQYLTSFEVEVSYINHTDFPDPYAGWCNSYSAVSLHPRTQLNITCVPGLAGRYVTIKRTGEGFRPQSLSLCEVNVMAINNVSSTSSSTTAARDSSILVATTTVVIAPQPLTPTILPATPSPAAGGISTTTAIIIGVVLGFFFLIALLITIVVVTILKRNPNSHTDKGSSTNQIRSGHRNTMLPPSESSLPPDTIYSIHDSVRTDDESSRYASLDRSGYTGSPPNYEELK